MLSRDGRVVREGLPHYANRFKIEFRLEKGDKRVWCTIKRSHSAINQTPRTSYNDKVIPRWDLGYKPADSGNTSP